ncbi:MAG: hypothetical protein AAGF73_12695 [Actinomycetota bacterium]
MTVYSQMLLPETADGSGDAAVISPPQLDPGTCGSDPLSGQTVCAHANAVYLVGSGQELVVSNGCGSWWIKHSWIVDGEGDRNCPALTPTRSPSSSSACPTDRACSMVWCSAWRIGSVDQPRLLFWVRSGNALGSHGGDRPSYLLPHVSPTSTEVA